MHHHERHPRGHAHHPTHLPRWPENAHYAPNYPIYPLGPAPVPIIHFPLAAVPLAAAFVPKPPHRRVKTSPPPRQMHPQPQPQLRHKISIPKKHVHFNVPFRNPPQKQPQRKPSQPRLQTHNAHHPPPPAQAPRPRPPHPLIPRHHPTIWIITFAHTLAPSPAAVSNILATELPTATPHLYTIPAYNFTPPPPNICAAYSGVSPIVQDYVMRDPRARKAVADAIHDILSFGRREMSKQKDGGARPRRDVALSVCCLYGTHRSVSVAERIAQGLMGMKLGVRVVVRHVHRVRGAKDLR